MENFGKDQYESKLLKKEVKKELKQINLGYGLIDHNQCINIGLDKTIPD